MTAPFMVAIHFLIGPYSTEPLKQAQRANQRNPALSIVILVFPEQFLKVKQALQLSYNVGKNVTCLPYESGKEISAVLENAILRTCQRKSFARISARVSDPVTPVKEIAFHNLAAFLEYIPMAALVLDAENNVAGANTNAGKMFALLANKTSGVNLAALLPGISVQQLTEGAQKGDMSPQVIKVNNQFLEITVSPVALGQNKPHFLCLITNVTRKIQTENTLQTKIEDLEFLNGELDQFLSIISHDFKTPLTSISVLLELAGREPGAEKKQVFIEQIKKSSDRLKGLLQGLNSMVDIKNSKAEKAELISFAERVNLITSEYQHNLQPINGKIVTDFTRAPFIHYSTAHIDSYLSNLITNAIKYRNVNEPLLITVQSRKEKEYVVLSIKDNGVGIDLNKNLNKLFQPFKRLTDMGTGSGLGLSIVKRMIERDQGYMEVYSQPGEGTEFVAYLKEQL